MNTKTCDTCANYDPVLRGENRGGHRNTVWAWCAKKSVYPMLEEPGQKFPPDVQRMTTTESPAKPYIVKHGQVVPSCTQYEEKANNVISKADLVRKLREQNGGLIPG